MTLEAVHAGIVVTVRGRPVTVKMVICSGPERQELRQPGEHRLREFIAKSGLHQAGDGEMFVCFVEQAAGAGSPDLGRAEPIAVVLDAEGIDAGDMQRLAAWTNLSETAFVLPPTQAGADYRLRIFTPAHELRFAGHPTVGAAHAVLEAGSVRGDAAHLTQECGAGLLALRTEGSGPERRIFVRVPEAKVLRDRAVDVDALGRALGAPVVAVPPPLVIDVGPVWLVAQIAEEKVLRSLAPDMAALAALSRDGGVTLFALGSVTGADVTVRSFAPAGGIPEDPVCGSGNATVAAYLATTDLLARVGAVYRASQGRERGRDGEVLVRVARGGREIVIGGAGVTLVEGP